MSGVRIDRANFSKGEIAPQVAARTDVAAYAAGLKRARNMIILKYGGVTKRPGTRFVAEVHDASQPVRLADFQFGLGQSYALELGQGYMRPLAYGGVILEQALAVTGITNARPAVVAVAHHGYAAGDQVYFADIQGMVEINGRIATVVDGTAEGMFSIDVDTTGFGVFTGSAGGMARTDPPDPSPPDPVVPPVPDPDPLPDTTGGGYAGACPIETAMILLANEARDGPGGTIAAGQLRAGQHWVWTRHETTMAWGAYHVTRAETFEAALWQADRFAETTGSHLWWLDDAWTRMDAIGRPSRVGRAVAITIEDAHTYVIVAGGAHWLSHNKQVQEQ